MSYRIQSVDTSYEAEQVQIAVFRQKGEAGRGDLMLSLTRTTRWLSWNSFLKLRPEISRQEAALAFLELTYGKELAGLVGEDLVRRSRSGLPFAVEKLLISEEMILALTPVIDVLEELGITYLIGGSVASSTHGIARATADADLVADLKPEHVTPIISRLQTDYYVSEIAMQEALARNASFNLIHLETGFKLDVFVLKTDPFNQSGFSRARITQLSKADPRLFRLDSPEDVLLQKLNWFRAGGKVSEKQWLDVLGILKMQPSLDFSYLEEWAEHLGLTELLAQAKEEAGRD